MGSHDTLGAKYVQYLPTDRIATPPEYAEPFYTERAALLENSFFMNEYRESRAHILTSDRIGRAEIGLPSAGFIFCSFNQLFKLDPPTFDSWMRMVKNVPDSVLWLLRLPTTAEASLRRVWRQNGLEEGRLLMSDRRDWDDHLNAKKWCDLSLDMPVFNSHTSGVAVLWIYFWRLFGACRRRTPRTRSNRRAASERSR